MAFTVLPHLKEKILHSYEQNIASHPQKRAEVEAFLQGKEETYALCLRFLYGHMHINDMVTYAPMQIGSYVSASLQAYDAFSYTKTIPQELFFAYVLQPRVNSEWLDESRQAMLEEISPYVSGKTMHQAILNVNYWCYSHATYTPADGRTLGPLAVMRRTLGRCGEESVLTVAAMRSVGIPARQCYAPRWSHCDDNHAWVEVWLDGDWHYLGACEPEPVLDKGWFTAAASRAMLVHTKCWSDLGGEPDIAYTTPLYGLVNHTFRYAQTKTLTVRLTEEGKPLPNVSVSFQIDNYSELYPIFTTKTNEKGIACFDTGLGDLCVSVCHRGKVLLRKVDMREKDSLELDLSRAQLPEELPPVVTMDFVPPVGTTDVPAPTEDPIHNERMLCCEGKRNEYKNTFPKTNADTILRYAAGNWQEVQRFLDDPRYASTDKEQILSTLREKDFVDITCDTLCDALDAALPVKQQHTETVFRDYVLAPRVADEMLLPYRKAVGELLPNGFENPEAIYVWMKENLETVCLAGGEEFYPGIYGCVNYRKVPAHSFHTVLVGLCRAFGFPARLHPATGEAQWLRDGVWQSSETKVWVDLCLENRSGKDLCYYEHFTLGRWNGASFETLRFDGLTLRKSGSVTVPVGFYRMITTTRQIDGTASVRMFHFDADCGKVAVQMPEDQTAKRLKSVPLLPMLPDGPVKEILQETAETCRILVFAEPGSEPTEHLLQEFLECENEFNRQVCPIRILLRRQEDLQNPTLQRVMQQLTGVQVRVCSDPDAQELLHTAMGIGDKRLPFVLSVDRQNRGVYAGANYSIRMAQTLLLIQKLISGGMNNDPNA